MTDDETPAEPPVEKTDAEKRKEEYEQLKAENDKVDAELLRREKLKAEVARGGKSDAGQAAEKPKEETNKEYRDRIDKEMAEGKTDFGN